MKKSLLAAMALMTATAASATTLNIEYSYDNVQGNKALNSSHYGYVGLAERTRYGTFDIGLQGVGLNYDRIGTDRAAGWEAGYSYSFPVQGVVRGLVITPRVAYGSMNQLNQGNARYWQASLDAQVPVTQNVGGFVNVRHVNGVTAAAPARTNRLQAGIDWAVAPRTNLRVGYSYSKRGDDNLSGVIVYGSYNF